MAEQSFWQRLGGSLGDSVIGITDTVGAGLSNALGDVLSADSVRAGRETRTRAETNIAEPSPLPPTGETRAANVAAEVNNAIMKNGLLLGAVALGAVVIAVKVSR